jgi:hypothetical protein
MKDNKIEIFKHNLAKNKKTKNSILEINNNNNNKYLLRLRNKEIYKGPDFYYLNRVKKYKKKFKKLKKKEKDKDYI